MCEAHIAPSAETKLSSFCTALKRHLTGLTIIVDPETFKTQQLGAFAMLPALQKLDLECARSGWRSYKQSIKYLDLRRERLALKLPHLVSLRLYGFERGKLVLRCPQLAEATFDDTESLHIEVKDAVLTRLKLLRCKKIQLTARSLGKQLQKLETLIVRDCSEVGGLLIGYVSQLNQLQRLEYILFPAACMPQSFPQSLVHLSLGPADWCDDLPRGLKKLGGLRDLIFEKRCKTWTITRPLAELLPTDTLHNLCLGNRQ